MKHLWAYIKAKDLQNPADKREILCDQALQDVFGEAKVTAFSMNKYISKNILGKVDS